MKCPECVKRGLRSSVTVGSGTSTLAHSPPFYDEDGRQHCHDANTSETTFSCSNGHGWSGVSEPAACWCGWTGAEGAGDTPGLTFSTGTTNKFQFSGAGANNFVMETAKVAERRNCGCFWLYLAAQPVVAPCAEHLAAIEGAVEEPAGA